MLLGWTLSIIFEFKVVLFTLFVNKKQYMCESCFLPKQLIYIIVALLKLFLSLKRKLQEKINV